MLKVAFGTVGVLAIAMLTGCAGAPSGASAAPEVQYTYQDPDTVEREQWSQAMVIAREGLGLYGLMDVVAPEGVSVSPNGQASFNGVDSLATGALGAASSTTHMSSGASLALGAGLFLLGGGASPTTAFSQLAFWVPADMASNAEEASLIAAQTYQEMRNKAFNPPRNNDLRATGKYLRGDSRAFANPKDRIQRRPVKFDGEAKKVEFGNLSEMFYGPIYIPLFGQDLYTDQRNNKIDWDELMGRMLSHMPTWSAAYINASYYDVPATILHDQEIHRFVVPQRP